MLLNVIYIVLLLHPYIIRANLKSKHLRITGGKEASNGRFPYFAQIYTVLTDTICGGTLIQEKIVLTAFHCIQYDPCKYEVVLGTNEYYSYVLQANKYEVEKAIKYPEPPEQNDICMLILSRPARIKAGVISLAPLPKFYLAKLQTNDSVIAIGFGISEDDNNGIPSKKLKMATLRYVTYIDCQNLYPHDEELSPSLLCAEGTPVDGDICTFDDGGPLLQNNYIIGVAVRTACLKPNTPSYFVRVENYVSWIRGAAIHYMDSFMNTSFANDCREVNTKKIKIMDFKKNGELRLCKDSCSTSELVHVASQKPCVLNPIMPLVYITSAECLKTIDENRKTVKILQPSDNLMVKLDDQESKIVEIILGSELKPYIAFEKCNLAIIKLESPFENIVYYNVYTNLDKRIPGTVYLVKHLFAEDSEKTVLFTMPVFSISALECSKTIMNVPFHVVDDLICIVTECPRPNGIYSWCSDKEAAPVFTPLGDLFGLAMWQDGCSLNLPSVVLDVSVIIKAYKEYIKKNSTNGIKDFYY